ncbi:MAG: hypothetical protein ABFD07_17970 [Methanobacterium sp.]
MRKLYEIGDQPLPISSIIRDDDDILYDFSVPLKAPEGEFSSEIRMRVIFARCSLSMRDLRYKSARFVKGDSHLLPLIEKGNELWDLVKSKIPDPYNDGIQMQGYEVLFRPHGCGSWHMQNFNDHSLPIKIMATVKYCVTDFIEKHKENLDIISFRADKDDRGRVLLYDRFSKLIGKSLHYNTMQFDGSFYEFVCMDPKKLREISLRLSKIKEILDERQVTEDTPIQDAEDINAFIQDIAEGKVKVSDAPKQLELFDDLELA